MPSVMTSDTHPIRVDFVEPERLGLPGKLGLTFAPGKKQSAGQSGHWDRDLETDLARLRDYYGTDVLVSLVEDHEFQSLQIPTLHKRCEFYEIDVLWFPIRDVSVPTSMEKFKVLVDTISSYLLGGRTVVIHCMGGLGRTGLVAAATVVATTTLTPEEAVEAVRKARPGAFETREQEEYITLFNTFRRSERFGAATRHS